MHRLALQAMHRLALQAMHRLALHHRLGPPGQPLVAIEAPRIEKAAPDAQTHTMVHTGMQSKQFVADAALPPAPGPPPRGQRACLSGLLLTALHLF